MNEIDMCHVMIDLETFGISSNAVIRSIGAVLFNMKGDTEVLLHRGVSTQSCLNVGLKIDGDTIDWWLKQSKENQDRLMSMKSLDLMIVLCELEAICNNTFKDLYMWSHGSNFDVVLLENAYKAIGNKAWWKYSNVRDTRTLFDVANYKYVAKGGHDALDDAMNKAKAVAEAYQQLKKGA